MKLSISLYTFAETVASADKNVKHIATDISLTSAALDQLGKQLKEDRKNGLASDDALRVIDNTVHECSELFREINVALDKVMGKGHGKLSKLKWPFLQSKTEYLRGNLEKLKSSLMLMVHVLEHATKTKR